MRQCLLFLLFFSIASTATIHASSTSTYTLPEVPQVGLYIIEGSTSKHEVLRGALSSRGWKEAKSGPKASYGFKWTWSESRLSVPSDRVVVNHFANFSRFTSKRGLLESLRASPNVARMMDSFVPRAYLSREEMPLFLTDFQRTVAHCNASLGESAQPTIDCGASAQTGGSLWIAKPATGTRGVGIKVFSDADALTAFVGTQQDFVIQKYIERPLLIHGRKFDIRQFVLVTSLDPLVVFASSQCYVRFSSKPYSADTLDNVVHLTNHQVQKKEPENPGDIAKDIHRNQWSLASFKEHIGSDVWGALLKPRIDRLIARTLSSWPNRERSHRRNSFELLGLDILVDQDLNPWLLEVNSDPGLHLLTRVVNDHHRTAVVDLLRVVLDERQQWKSAGAYTCLLSDQEDSSCQQEGAVSVGVWQLVLKSAP